MVPSTFLRYKPARCLPVLLAALVFTGCGTHVPDQSAAFMQGTTQADSSYYLQQMQQSTDNSKTNWQLLAIRALLQEGKKRQAIELFKLLPSPLNDVQRREQLLLAPEIKLAQNDYAGAQALLDKINPTTLRENQQLRYWQTQIDASQSRPSLTLLRALVARQRLLNTPVQQQQNIDDTWKALTSMPQAQANTLYINANENVLRGWLDLQQTWFASRSDPAMLKSAIKDWQTRYPRNPGARMLPTQLTNMQSYQPSSVNTIALLLPLNGQAAVFGRTIQQGFEAAKNGVPSVTTNAASEQLPQETNTGDDGVVSPSQAETSELTASHSGAEGAQSRPHQQSITTPATNPATTLRVYDTTAQPINQLLAQVAQDGATIVVGPLLKNNVEEVIRSNTSLNILALNQPENIENRMNVCYFALSPEDEAREAARHIYEQGKRTPLLLAPRGTLGDRVVNAFASEWLNMGGSGVLQQRFGSTAELKSGVNSGISLRGTQVAAAQDSAFSDETVSGGVDAAWIMATQAQIAYIKPMIAMRNGSRSGVTLYASSRSAGGVTGPDFRLEMEGLQYSEIPMLAGDNPQLMQQALAAVHNDYSLARLYAMGVDAWTLANHFTQLRQGVTLNGNTGFLTATPECAINRRLAWLQYQHGQIIAAGSEN